MYKHISSQLLVEGNIMYGEREEGQLGEKTLRLKKSWAFAAVTDTNTQNGPHVPNWPFPNWGLRGLKGPWGVQTGPQLPMTTQLNYSRFYVSGNDARTCHATTLIPSTVDTNTAHCPKSSLMGVWGLCAPRRFALNNNTALIRLVFVALEGWDTLSALGEAPAVIYVLFAPHSF